jgi:uncharacterized protein (TIGR02145 family)
MKKGILTTLIFGLLSFVSSAQTTIMNIYQNNGNVIQVPLNTIDSITYTISNPGVLATLITLPIGNITATSAVSGGTISNSGGTTITHRGICWNNTPNPTTADSMIENGAGTGSFTINLSWLSPNTTYYVRAFAINSAGTAYGNELSFTTSTSNTIISSNPGAGVTFNGYTYTSIVLGNGQEWMSENLKTTVYANGDPIPNVTDSLQWLTTTSGAWAYYNDNSSFNSQYGKLYNWYTVVDSRNVCPNGWHVPTDLEWTILTDYLGGLIVSGGKMKNTGTQYWQSPNLAATNNIGFSALPGGYRSMFNSFFEIGNFAYFWSTSVFNSTNAWTRYLSFNSASTFKDGNSKSDGFSVRCLKN